MKKHKVEGVVVALLDPALRNPESWFGIVDYHLSDKLYVDLSNEDNLHESISKLCNEIRKTCAKSWYQFWCCSN